MHTSTELARKALRPAMIAHFNPKAAVGKQSAATPRRAASCRSQCEFDIVITLPAPSGTHASFASNSVVAVDEAVDEIVDTADDVADDVIVEVWVVDGLVTLQPANSCVAAYVITLFNPATLSLAQAATASGSGMSIARNPPIEHPSLDGAASDRSNR